MYSFQAKSLCILGRQPELGLAELESLFGAEHVQRIGNNALLDVETKEINFKRLGGTIKVAQILTFRPTTKWQDLLQYLTDEIPGHMQYQPEGKFTFGLSIYGLPVSLAEQNKGLMAIKRIIRSTGKAVRVVPNKSSVLNSAQVLHNKLTTRGAWELMLVRDGHQTILAQTIFVQDIEAYAARDQARPMRDAKVGMLPPKLAQIMINLASGKIQPSQNIFLLDPFCGSGVILQEAHLMGFSAVGSDFDSRMVDYAKQNILWLQNKNSNAAIGGETSMQIEVGDATSHKWSKVNLVASEIYLGKPLSTHPSSEDLYKIADDVNELLKKFLINLKPQLQNDSRFCLAVPAWRTRTGFVHLPALENLSDLGYNRMEFKKVKSSELIYFRNDQIVARQLIVLEKK
jgi:tRNA G10  N-methylase Trm11